MLARWRLSMSVALVAQPWLSVTPVLYLMESSCMESMSPAERWGSGGRRPPQAP